MACLKTVASLFTASSGGTDVYRYLGYAATNDQCEECTDDPVVNCPNPVNTILINGTGKAPGTIVNGADVINPIGADEGYYYFEKCTTAGSPPNECENCVCSYERVVPAPSNFDDCSIFYCYSSTGSPDLITLYDEWDAQCSNAPTLAEAQSVDWSTIPSNGNIGAKFTNNAPGIENDTVNLDGLQVGTYNFVFTYTSPGSDPSCVDCTKEKTLSLVIGTNPSPGTPVNVTVCNAA